MADQWYYVTDGKKNGPVTSRVLKELADSGELLPSDQVQKYGALAWQRADTLKGLMPTRPVDSQRSTTAERTAPPVPVPPTRPIPLGVNRIEDNVTPDDSEDNSTSNDPSEPSQASQDDFWETLDDAVDESSGYPAARLPKVLPKSNRKNKGSARAQRQTNGAVFERYFAVEYLRTLWMLNYYLAMASIALIVVFTVVFAIQSFVNEKDLLDHARIIGGGIGLCIATLFELISVRIGLETVAVFFDMVHALRRIAGDE